MDDSYTGDRRAKIMTHSRNGLDIHIESHENKPMSQFQNVPSRSISALGKNFNPRNTRNPI
jgi:hypothetical protein